MILVFGEELYLFSDCHKGSSLFVKVTGWIVAITLKLSFNVDLKVIRSKEFCKTCNWTPILDRIYGRIAGH